MADRTLKVRLKAEGENQVKQAINGTVTKSKQAQEKARQEARKTKDEQKKAAEEGARATKKSLEDQVRDTTAAERRKRAEFQRTLHQMERMDRRQMSNRGGVFDRRGGSGGTGGFFTRSAEHAVGNLQSAGIQSVIGGLRDVLQTFVGRLEGIQASLGQRFGQRGIGENTANAAEVRLEATRLGNQVFSDMAPEQRARETENLINEINAVAEATNQDPGVLLESLTGLQEEFSAFEYGRRNLHAMAAEATRTGSEMGELARFVGVLQHQLGETAPDAQRVFDIMEMQGRQGAITPEQLARDFGGMFGTFTEMSGLRGEDALRQFGALANALKTKDMTPAETATLMSNMFTALGNSPTRDALRIATGGREVTRRNARGERETVTTGGTTALREDGTIDFLRLIEDMSTVNQIGSSDVVFRDSQARQAAGQLVSLQRRKAAGENVLTAADYVGVDAEQGFSYRNTGFNEVMQTDAMISRNQAISAQVEAIQNSEGRIKQSQVAQEFSNVAQATDGIGGAIMSLLDDMGVDQLVGSIARDGSATGLRTAAKWTGGGQGWLSGSVGGIFNSLAGMGESVAERFADRTQNAAAASLTREDVSGALHERPLQVTIVGGMPAPNTVDPRRTQSPRERTGR